MTYCTPSVSEIPLVAVEGTVNPTAALALRRRLASALGFGRRFVAVDLRAVTIDGEPAMTLLCDALREVDRHDARLALAGPPPAVSGALERAGIDGVELYPTLGAAVAAAGRRGKRAVRPVAPATVPAFSH